MRQASFVLSFVFFICVPPLRAQEKNSLTDLQAREAAEHALKPADSSVTDKTIRAQRRRDLEVRLLVFDAKAPADPVYFYDQPSPSSFDSSPFRMVAVAHATRDVYRLSGFDSPPEPTESLREFNRLTSTLELSVAKERAVNLAALFLDSAVPGGPGEIAFDEDALWVRLAVQNHYFAAYGDLWRALDAYAGWWEQFRAATPELSPMVTPEANGRYRVALKRLVRFPGRQPEVQNWELAISRNGEVQILSMQLIFPVHPDWIFYDFRDQ